MGRLNPSIGVALALVIGASLAGCAHAVTTIAAPSATLSACADVLVNLPQQVGAADRREVTAQATAAWVNNDRPAIVLTCGVTPPGPSTDPCTRVGEVDWVVDEVDAQVRYRSFGRIPAVQIEVPLDQQDGVDLLLSSASATLAAQPAERACT